MFEVNDLDYLRLAVDHIIRLKLFKFTNYSIIRSLELHSSKLEGIHVGIATEKSPEFAIPCKLT
jgi:hypothetical protein